MSEYLPKFPQGQAMTFAVKSAVEGGQLVEIVEANAVGPAGADSAKVVGVAGFDAGVGQMVTVYAGGVQRVKAAGAVTAGAKVYAAAEGQVQASGTNALGLALNAVAKAGEIVEVLI